jgi:virginiamycin B lyase
MTRRPVARAISVVVMLLYVAGLASAQGSITVTQHRLPRQNSNPWHLTAGPDGAIWYTVSCPYVPTCPTKVFDAIGRFTMEGTFSEFHLPGDSVDREPYGITTGADGALWFTEFQAGKIGRITTAGIISEYTLPTPNAGPYDITTGPDDALWFTEPGVGKIGRITTTGSVTEYPVPGACCLTDPTDIVVGPDGALWFTNINSSWIGRITTQGDISKYPSPLQLPDHGIATGPDKALWVTTVGGLIWRVTTEGVFTSFNVPTQDPGLTYITLGPDNALWFTENYRGKVGRVTTGGLFTEQYVGGTFYSGPVAITQGPDGNVWFGRFEYLGRLTLPDTAPPAIAVSVSPNRLWPPNGKMTSVRISGTITDTGSGVNTKTAAYSVKDQYGTVQPHGAITLARDGTYSTTILLQASRNGRDLDGRSYTVAVTAADNAGNFGSNTTVVVVAHDQGH